MPLYSIDQIFCPVFTIQCAVCQPDGSNLPFEIPSTIALDELHDSVAKKLKHYAGLVLLQYRLDSNKAKVGTTSIETDTEFSIFKVKMRTLIVPQHLTNGKISTRPLKNCLVYFEDGGAEHASGNGNKSVRTHKPVFKLPDIVLGHNNLTDSTIK